MDKLSERMAWAIESCVDSWSELEEEAIKKGIDRLAYYEDLEEQGRLVILPCKAGDSLYDISEFFEFYEHPEMYKLIANYIEIRKNSRGETIFCIDGIDLKLDDFGKTVFLSREEALKALRGE